MLQFAYLPLMIRPMQRWKVDGLLCALSALLLAAAGSGQGHPEAHQELDAVRPQQPGSGGHAQSQLLRPHAHPGPGPARHHVRPRLHRHRQNGLRQDPRLRAAHVAPHQGSAPAGVRGRAGGPRHGPHARARHPDRQGRPALLQAAGPHLHLRVRRFRRRRPDLRAQTRRRDHRLHAWAHDRRPGDLSRQDHQPAPCDLPGHGRGGPHV